MTDDLVTQIAKAIYDVNPELQMWDGNPYAFHEKGAKYKKDLAIRQARVVVAVLDLTGVSS